MPKMIMLVGVTGCGKTTYRKNHYPNVPCISPDDFIIGRYTPRKQSLAWGHAWWTAHEFYKAGEDFLIDAQFVDPDLRSTWVKEAKAWGFTVEAVVLDTPWNQLLKNHKKRGDRGGYGEVPMDVIRRNFQTFRRTMDSKKETFKKFDRVTFVKWGKWPA